MRPWHVLAVGLVLRLLIAVFLPPNWDVDSYGIVAEIVRGGGNVYAETSRYNYSPVWMGVIGALSFVPVPLSVAVRMFLSLCDAVNAACVYDIARLSGRGRPLRLMMLYYLNPATMLIAAYAGQFELLALLPILLWLRYYFSQGLPRFS